MTSIVHVLSGLAICLILFASCGTAPMEEVKEVIEPEISVRYGDTLVQQLINLQDRLDAQSVAAYLDDVNPTSRFLATRSFASLRDSSFMSLVADRLFDTKPETQQAAAFSLGQMGHPGAVPQLIEAFQKQDTGNANNAISSTILEAVGKCAGLTELDQLASVETYRPSDNHLMEGLARAIYRFMQRGITSPLGTTRMIEILKDDHTRATSVYAANYLARGNVNLGSHIDDLLKIYRAKTQPHLRMSLVYALGKTKSNAALSVLLDDLDQNEDYRIKCNILRTLGQNYYGLAKQAIHKRLYDRNLKISRTAVDVMVEHGSSRYWREYQNLSLGDYPWPIKIGLLHATNKYIPAGNNMFQKINEDLLTQRLRNSRDSYEKAAAIAALCDNPASINYVFDRYERSNDPIVLSAVMQSLYGLASGNRFSKLSRKIREQVVETTGKALLSGDIGQVYMASQIFGLDKIDFGDYGVDASAMLTKALEKLELPKDIEAFQEVTRLLDRGQQSGSPSYTYSHPIDWRDVTAVSDSSIVEVSTNRGSFRMQLMPSLAPATVANFTELIELKFFEGKNFHRVVPNFVIQGGCSRGDGFGSMDYTIRSELAQKYFDDEGYVGMASAGNHTESAQWFVTHSPTPHLDGNYTIFAKVVSGMDIVHKINVGDVIENVTII